MIYNRYNKPPIVESIVAYTTPKTGVTYTDGISGLDGDDINLIAKAISKNSAITSNTAELWVSGYDRHISIGDVISYTLSETDYPFRIMGFNHYALTNPTAYGSATATGKAGILMQMVNCFNTKQKMNATAESTIGWHNSDLRTWLNETMLGYFPLSTQNAIKQVNIQTAQNVETATLNTTADKLFLPAEVEVFGTTTYAKGGTDEGTRYKWYTENDTAANRAKTVNGSSEYWFERSPCSWNANIMAFCAVSQSGGANNRNGDVARGVPLCFCI